MVRPGNELAHALPCARCGPGHEHCSRSTCLRPGPDPPACGGRRRDRRRLEGQPSDRHRQGGTRFWPRWCGRHLRPERGDRLYGERGNDVVLGDRGNDRIWGLGLEDTLDGGPGNDELWGGWGQDVVEGGRGADLITLREDDNQIDTADCGGGFDVAIIRRGDRAFNCETIRWRRGAAPQGVAVFLRRPTLRSRPRSPTTSGISSWAPSETTQSMPAQATT
jgi:hypothetical protein